MKFPFRIRNRTGRRRPVAIEDVAATLATLRRPRSDELRFGMLLAGEALYQPLDPDTQAPEPDDGRVSEEGEGGMAEAPPQLPPDLHEAAAAPTADEDDDAVTAPAEAEGPPPAPPAAIGGPAAMPAVEASAVATGGVVLQAADLPPTIIAQAATTTATTTTAVPPQPTPPVVGDPPVTDVADPVVDSGGGDAVVTPTVPTIAVPTPASAPADPGGGEPAVDTPLPPGIYVDIDQDIVSTTTSGISADVDGDFAQSVSGGSTGSGTTCEVDYLADGGGLPDSLWWAGWQKVIFRVDIVQIESWLQNIDVDIDDTGGGEGVRVLIDQETWINQTAAIAIAAHAEDSVLTITTQATIVTHVIQYTQVIVELGHITGTSGEAPLLPPENDAVLESDQDAGTAGPVEVIVEQSVVLTQAVTVTTDIQEGLELHLDALLGQISGVLQQVQVSVELADDEATIVVDADQSADLQQELGVSVAVDDATGTLLVPHEEGEEEGEQVQWADLEDSDSDDDGDDDSDGNGDANADDESGDEALVDLIDAAFAEGEDVSFESAFEGDPGTGPAEPAEEEDEDTPVGGQLDSAVAAGNDDDEASIDVAIEVDDDDNHHLAAQ